MVEFVAYAPYAILLLSYVIGVKKLAMRRAYGPPSTRTQSVCAAGFLVLPVLILGGAYLITRVTCPPPFASMCIPEAIAMLSLSWIVAVIHLLYARFGTR